MAVSDDFSDFLNLTSYAALTNAIAAALGTPALLLVGRTFLYSSRTGQVSLVNGDGYQLAIKLAPGLTPANISGNPSGVQKYAGDTWDFPVTVLGDDGSPVDVTGDVLWFTLKASNDQAALELCQFNSTVPSGAPAEAGQGTISVPPATNASVTPGLYWYYIQCVDGSQSPPVVRTVASFAITILASATRPPP
jgi:hypothetical protein